MLTSGGASVAAGEAQGRELQDCRQKSVSRFDVQSDAMANEESCAVGDKVLLCRCMSGWRCVSEESDPPTPVQGFARNRTLRRGRRT